MGRSFCITRIFECQECGYGHESTQTYHENTKEILIDEIAIDKEIDGRYQSHNQPLERKQARAYM